MAITFNTFLLKLLIGGGAVEGIYCVARVGLVAHRSCAHCHILYPVLWDSSQTMSQRGCSTQYTPVNRHVLVKADVISQDGVRAACHF